MWVIEMVLYGLIYLQSFKKIDAGFQVISTDGMDLLYRLLKWAQVALYTYHVQ
jgi:hypothetical protein